jgi:hypothetical protein
MRPYNLHWRAKARRQSALERLEKRIKVLSGSPDAKDSLKLNRAREEAASLIKKIGSAP